MPDIRPILVLILLGSAATAQTLEPRQLADGLFTSIDRDGDDRITLEESLSYNEDVLVSMDSDGDGSATRDEFLSWGVGFAAAAEMRMRTDELQVANRIIFELMDENGDGALGLDEMNAFQSAAFDTADTNADKALTTEEFYDRHFMNIAARVALR